MGIGLNRELTPGSKSNQNYPKIAGTGNNIVAVWQEANSGSLNILARASNSGVNGLLSGEIDTVNLPVSGSRQNPDIVADGEIFHVVWQDNRNRKIIYRRGVLQGSVGISSLNQTNNPEIYPNPADDKLYITSHTSMRRIGITDIQGKERLVWNVEGRSMEVDVSSLRSGIYLLHIETEGGVRSLQKIIVD